MSNTLRTSLRRKLAAAIAAPMLLAMATAATPLPVVEVRAEAADRVAYKDTYYSNSSYTTIVGVRYGYCDGDYIMSSGYATSYFTTKYYPPCP